MEETTAMAIIGVARAVAAIVAMGGAIFLAFHEREGWGWLVLVAVMLGTFSVKFD